MIPYADFLYFGVLLYVVVPTVILGLVGRASRVWISIATLAMLAVQYGASVSFGGVALREIWLVAGYALFQWIVALGLLRARSRTKRHGPFYLAVVLALLPLIFAKYVPLVAASPIGFLGISYLTFRSLDVLFCVQDRLITSLPPGQHLAYLLFFPTISAGPIDRYRRFDADWKHQRTRAEFLQDLDGAVDRVFRGFLYKFILAALVRRYWLEPIADGAGFANALSYMYAYSFYLFFDFAGYSAFAIGFSYLLGIHTPENFDRPFLARNIRDFWNRWHITLSWWLRDHIYMRFVMAAMKGRWFKRRYTPSYLGLFLAFGLMGLWHGTALHYLLYGLYHGALLSAHEAFTRWDKRRRLWGDGLVWRAFGIFATFNLVCFGFLLFSGYLTSGWSDRAATANDVRSYEGRFEKASCDEIAGWAWNARDPQTPVTVEIHADGSLLDTVSADLYRPDLQVAGKGSGAHAFVYVPPAALADGRAHLISVRVAGSESDLGETPRTIVCERSVQAMDGYEGDHEIADCEQISGWAWDMTQPDRSIGVDIYGDGVKLATVAADRDRIDLRDAGQGRHGFSASLPAQMKDGDPHTISVRISGSNVTLRNTPRIIVCGTGSAAQEGLIGGQVAAAPSPSAPPEPGAQPGEKTKRVELRPLIDNRDGTITDPNTGLMWEKKVGMNGQPDASNPSDADNCYPWAGTCALGAAECRVDADCGSNGPCQAGDCQRPAPDGLTIFEWVAQLNAKSFGGYRDWRMPSSEELYSIVNPMEEGDPAVNAAFKGASCGGACGDLGDPSCSCAQPGLYWAAPATGPRPDESWMMFFYCNGHLFLDLKSNRFFVRAVRGG